MEGASLTDGCAGVGLSSYRTFACSLVFGFDWTEWVSSADGRMLLVLTSTVAVSAVLIAVSDDISAAFDIRTESSCVGGIEKYNTAPEAIKMLIMPK